MRWGIAFLVVLLVLASTAAAARAEDLAGVSRSPSDSPWIPCEAGGCGAVYERPFTMAPAKRWHAVLGAYAWASSIDGTSYADGQETDIDVPFSDIFDKLDSAFMGYAEFQYDRFSIALDGSYVALEDEGLTPNTGLPFKSEIDQTILDLRLGYTVLCRQVGKETWGRCCYDRTLTLDAILGVRYWNVEQEVTVTTQVAGPVSFNGDTDWWDPYVGARFRWPFAKRWGWTLYGDIGGFDIGSASKLTWQIQTYLTFHITRGLFVAVGYRALDVDRTEGSGTSKDGVDATLHGPVVGLGFTF